MSKESISLVTLPERLDFSATNLYFENLEASFQDVQQEKRKIALLLNFMGGEGLQIYSIFDKPIEENTLERVIKLFKQHFAP